MGNNTKKDQKPETWYTILVVVTSFGLLFFYATCP